jgi:hypothetical protein
VTATVLFTTSTRSYDGYWFITLTTALTLTFGMAIAAIPSKAAVKWIGVALLLRRVAAAGPHRRLEAVLQVPAICDRCSRLARGGECARRCCATSSRTSRCIRRWIGASSTRFSAAIGSRPRLHSASAADGSDH